MPTIRNNELIKINDDEIINDTYYIPENVEIIGDSCFSDNDYLKKIIMPNSVKTVGIYAFNNCSELESVTMSDNIESIGENCFDACTKLKNVTLPNINKIQENTFFSCINLTNVNMPDNLSTIYRGAFYNCVSLDNVNFGSNVKRIMDDAFFNNISLNKIELLNSDMIIDDMAFSNCYSLSDITVSSSVKYISPSAFFADQSVKRIKIVFPDKALTFNVNYGIDPIMNTIYKTNNIFCINQNDNLFLTIDNNGNIKKYSGENFAKIFYSGLLSKMHYISEVLNKKSINDFDYNIVNVLPLYNDSIKSFYQNKNEWFSLIEKYETLKEEDLSIIFDLCFALGLFSPNEVEKSKASYFINEFLKNDENVESFIMKKPFLLENGYDRHFASTFMNIYNSSLNKKQIINSFADFYKNFYKICDFTTNRKIKDRTKVHGRITQIMKENENYLENQEYKDLIVKEIVLTKMIKNRCKDYLTFDDYIYYIKNSDYEFKENNSELNIIKPYLKGQSRDKLDEIEKFWENAKSSVDESKSAFIKVEDNASSNIKYEMLDSLNPLNLVIGDLVNCCATVNNPVGVYIAKECILNDQVKCIIVKNENNEIIGKTTCYFNKEGRYLLLNNFEVSDKFNGSTSLLRREERLERKTEVLSAFERFIQDEINALNSFEIQNSGTYAVTKAYVGMRNNDLSEEIKELFVPIINTGLLENVSFSDEYEGDANSYSDGQCIIYDNDLNIVGGRRSRC